MAQHDYNIANQSGADFRADLNNALLAIATVNSGATEPSTTFAHQLWVDTSSSVLKIRNSADNAWITTGVSITASNTFTGDLTGNVTGNLTGNVTGNVTGDLTGNADSADILTTARTISLSGDVVGSVSFDGSTNVDIDTVVQINSITLGTDTTGDYVESMSGGTGVTVTGGTGEGSTPSIAIGQSVATTDNVTFNLVTATDEFVGDIDGAVRFSAKADEALSKGDIIYVSGVSGNTPTVGKAKADDASKMPAFGIAAEDANANTNLQIVTLGNLINVDTSNESVGEILYVSTTAGEYSTTAPTGESSQIQNIGKVLRSHAVNGSIKVGGAGRSNATPNLDNGKIFIGNGSNQSTTATLDTSIVVENTNLYYTTARANTDFDSRLATKDTGDLTEGSNLYYTTARVNTDFDTRLATKDTGDLSEGSNLYYTDARVNSAFDTRLATKDTDDVSEGTTNLYYTTSRTNTDFDTRLATKSTSDLAEGTNLYYTSARFDSAFTSKDTDDLSEGTTNLYYTTTRFDSAFGNKTTADLTENTNLYYTDTRANSAIDARVTKAFVDALGIQANTVAANSVALGTDTVGNYVATVTGTANKITVSGSGSESADVTLSLPDDVQIADSLTVAGNLTVNGTLTSLDTTNLDIEDNLFQLNAGLTGSPVNDSGMLINRGTADNSIFMWDESVDKFTMGLTTADGSATGNITLNSLGTLVVNVEGNLTGNVTGTVSSLSNHDTDDLTEGSNLYYTQARFDSAFTAKSTSDLSEGTNLYYTDARFDTRLASKDTDDVSEGTSNLYYTSTRFDSAFGGKSTSDLSEGSNLYYTDARVQAISINNVVEDTTPQLGGNLDLNSSDITGTGDINITGTITSGAVTSNDRITGDGTEAAPAFRFATDTNTGMFPPSGGDVIGFATGGTERLRITSAGLVGIGIDNPSGTLHVRGETNSNGAELFLQVNNNNTTDNLGAIHWGNNTDNTISTILSGTSGNSRSSYLTFSTSSVGAMSEAMRITSAGLVGIGTTSPSTKLHILDSDYTTMSIQAGTTSHGAILNLGDSGDINYGSITQFASSAGEGGRMRFIAGTTETMNLRGGNVGIGTTSPSGKLHVEGATSGANFIIDDGSGYGVYVAAQNAFNFNYGRNETSDGYINFRGYQDGNTQFRNLHIGNGKQSTIATFDGVNSRVGIGTTSPISKLHIDGAENNTGGITLTAGAQAHNWYLASDFVNVHDIGTGSASAAHTWHINGSEKMRINSAGSVGIGKTSPAFILDVASADDGLARFTSTDANAYITIGDVNSTSAHNKIGVTTHDMWFNTNGSERMRIEASGDTRFGCTSAQLTAGEVFSFNNGQRGNTLALNTVGGASFYSIDMWNNAGGTCNQILFRSGGSATTVGSITSTGNNATQYNTSSDYRLKENVAPIQNGLTRLQQLNPVQFDWKNSGETSEGFIAHEVQEIFSDAVTGEKDAEEMQGMDYGRITPLLVKAIQEQQIQIEALQSEINLLKGE
jgi:hypothetical protein